MLCGSKESPYPPIQSEEFYKQLGQSLLVSASRPFGGVGGVDFQWSGAQPDKITADGLNIGYACFPPWIQDTDNTIAPYSVYYTMFGFYMGGSAIEVIYNKSSTPSGFEFIPNKCIPVYNCSSCSIIAASGNTLHFSVDIETIGTGSHIHLEYNPRD